MNNKTEVSKQLLWAGILALLISLVFNIGQIAKQHALRSSIDRFTYAITVAQTQDEAEAAAMRFAYETNPRYTSAQAGFGSFFKKIGSWFNRSSNDPSDPHSANYQGSGHCTSWMGGGECFDYVQ